MRELMLLSISAIWSFGWIMTWGYLDKLNQERGGNLSTFTLGIISLFGWPFYAAKALFVRLEPRAKKR